MCRSTRKTPPGEPERGETGRRRSSRAHHRIGEPLAGLGRVERLARLHETARSEMVERAPQLGVGEPLEVLASCWDLARVVETQPPVNPLLYAYELVRGSPIGSPDGAMIDEPRHRASMKPTGPASVHGVGPDSRDGEAQLLGYLLRCDPRPRDRALHDLRSSVASGPHAGAAACALTASRSLARRRRSSGPRSARAVPCVPRNASTCSTVTPRSVA